jgi:hypothetical protein
MAIYHRLQPLKQVNAAGKQAIEFALDADEFKTLTICVRKPVAAMTGTLRIQSASVLEESAFVDNTVFSFNLGSTTTEVYIFDGLLRYVRWSVETLTMGPAVFMIDVIAREN